MKNSVPGDDWPPMAPRRRLGHRCHLVSIAMPFVGLAIAIGYLYVIGLNPWSDRSKQDHNRIARAFWLLGIAGGVGLIAAGKSIARKEKPEFLAALGVLLNIPPVLLWLMSVAEYVIDRSGIK